MRTVDRARAAASRAFAGLRDRHSAIDLTARAYARFQATEAQVSAVHIAYSAFFSLFPLLFVAVGIFGFVLRGHAALRAHVLASVASSFPGPLGTLIRSTLASAQHSAQTSVGVGLVLLLYSGTGMVLAVERGLNRALGVSLPAGFVAQRLRALGWLVTAGTVAALSVVAAGALGGATKVILSATGVHGGLASAGVYAAGFAISFAVDVALFVVTLWLLPNRATRPRQVLPWALLCALWWGALKTVGAWYVKRSIAGAAAVFGQLAIVVGLLVFANLAAQLLLFTASLEAERLGVPQPAESIPTGAR